LIFKTFKKKYLSHDTIPLKMRDTGDNWNNFNMTIANLHLKKRLPQQRDAGPSPVPNENIMMRANFFSLPEIISLQDKITY
jgi:hypothetical protein